MCMKFGGDWCVRANVYFECECEYNLILRTLNMRRSVQNGLKQGLDE